MNKYEEALKRLQEETIPNPYTLNNNDEDFATLRELVDKSQDLQDGIERLEKLEKVIEILKRICLFEFEEGTIYQWDEWDDCYVIYVTQFNNGFNKEEYDLLKEVLKND